MNRYILPTLMCLRPRRHIITPKSIKILHDMSLTALRNDYDQKTACARIRTGDLKVEENPDRSFDTNVTVTVVKQGVCRGTLTWMMCVRK